MDQRRGLLTTGHIGLRKTQGRRLEDLLPAPEWGLVLYQTAQHPHMLGEPDGRRPDEHVLVELEAKLPVVVLVHQLHPVVVVAAPPLTEGG